MSIETALRAGRRAAERTMSDTCRITRPGEGQGPFNPETGQYDDPLPVTVYEGKCRIPRRGTATTTTAAAGEQAFQVGEYPFEIPVEGDGYVVGEEVKPGQTVTYLTAAYDPSLAGRVFGIVDPVFQSQATKRRFKIKANVGP